jgi:hypothetical protein
VLEMPGNSNPTYCALICDPSQKQCGTATCQPIQVRIMSLQSVLR